MSARVCSCAMPIATTSLCQWHTAHLDNTSWPMCLHEQGRDRILSHAIAHSGCFECAAVLDVLAILRTQPNASLVDIGANIGFYTLAAAATGAAAHIDAFEASPTNAMMVQQSLERNGLQARATIFALALAADVGLLRLGGSRSNQGGLHHLEAVGGTQVARLPLDQVLAPPVSPTVVKLDVEGAECGVARGALGTTRNRAIISLLSPRGALTPTPIARAKACATLCETRLLSWPSSSRSSSRAAAATSGAPREGSLRSFTSSTGCARMTTAPTALLNAPYCALRAARRGAAGRAACIMSSGSAVRLRCKRTFDLIHFSIHFRVASRRLAQNE